MSETIVIYHGGCPDGFTAAWAFRKLRPDVRPVFHPGRFGEPPPDVRGKHVYVCDFSYPRETLLRMNADAASLLVLDHHKTAQADLDGLPFCVFDMDRSGAGLTWDHLAAGGARPWLVDVVEDRDLWRFRLGDRTRQVSAYLATVPMTFEAWDEVMAAGRKPRRRRAPRSRRTSTATARRPASTRSCAPSAGTRCRSSTSSTRTARTTCSGSASSTRSIRSAASFFLGKGGRWYFSLRSIGEFDVSAVARVYGGGGHKNAAGFDVAALPWGEAS